LDLHLRSHFLLVLNEIFLKCVHRVRDFLDLHLFKNLAQVLSRDRAVYQPDPGIAQLDLVLRNLSLFVFNKIFLKCVHRVRDFLRDCQNTFFFRLADNTFNRPVALMTPHSASDFLALEKHQGDK
jgi:hypothetical protein